MTVSGNKVTGSFRDLAGFMFSDGDTLYRQVNQLYQPHYDWLMSSGLYQQLVKSGQLVAHEEVDNSLAQTSEVYKVIQPEHIAFVSYPYEWSFSQLKAAALLTLKVQRMALDKDMTLKDASAFNVQFVGDRPLLIDTLSFERYEEGLPWVAYRQFCQHFLAPLALMSFVDVRLSQLLRTNIDGVPLDLTAAALPGRTRFNFGLNMHIRLHARSQQRYADVVVDRDKVRRVSKQGLLGLLANLESTIKKLKWNPSTTAWADYYEDDSYDQSGLAHKQELVAEFLNEANPKTVWDLGANTGLYSRIAVEAGAQHVVAMDGDPGSVDLNYRSLKGEKLPVLPLVIDLTNPSPALGWEHSERESLLQRGLADAVLALALVHHLAIANNVPLERVADFFAQICRWLVVEFVPKGDPKVDKLLATREDIFVDYTPEGFERAFGERFKIVRSETIEHSKRRLYLLDQKDFK